MSGWVVEGWHILAVLGVGLLCGLVLGAKLTADTLQRRRLDDPFVGWTDREHRT